MELDNGILNGKIDEWISKNLEQYKKEREQAKAARYVLVKWPYLKNGLLFGIVRIDNLYAFLDPITHYCTYNISKSRNTSVYNDILGSFSS